MKTMTIETKTFGTVTITVERGDCGLRHLWFSAAGQQRDLPQIRPAKSSNEFIVELSFGWLRPDGTRSPGFKITAEQRAELVALKNSDPSVEILPLGKTQIWDQSDK